MTMPACQHACGKTNICQQQHTHQYNEPTIQQPQQPQRQEQQQHNTRTTKTTQNNNTP